MTENSLTILNWFLHVPTLSAPLLTHPKIYSLFEFCKEKCELETGNSCPSFFGLKTKKKKIKDYENNDFQKLF